MFSTDDRVLGLLVAVYRTAKAARTLRDGIPDVGTERISPESEWEDLSDDDLDDVPLVGVENDEPPRRRASQPGPPLGAHRRSVTWGGEVRAESAVLTPRSEAQPPSRPAPSAAGVQVSSDEELWQAMVRFWIMFAFLQAGADWNIWYMHELRTLLAFTILVPRSGLRWVRVMWGAAEPALSASLPALDNLRRSLKVLLLVAARPLLTGLVVLLAPRAAEDRTGDCDEAREAAKETVEAIKSLHRRKETESLRQWQRDRRSVQQSATSGAFMARLIAAATSRSEERPGVGRVPEVEAEDPDAADDDVHDRERRTTIAERPISAGWADRLRGWIPGAQ